MLYFALIGDIIDSRKLPNRNEVQVRLVECLDMINDHYQDYIVSKLSVTLGDEFQGLLGLEAPLFKILDTINLYMEPCRLRFGIGKGEILTEINPEQSIGADGPAYWFAREAIDYIHQKNDYGNTQLAVKLSDEQETLVINSILAAGEAIKSDWRASQKSLLKTLIDIDDYDEQFNQQAVGEALSLTSSTLSKRLKSSSIKVYLRSRNTALNMLRKELEIKEVPS